MIEESDDDEQDVRRKRIAREIETAFADAPYPGDDNINQSARFHDAESMARVFKGRQWTDLSPEELSDQRFSIYHFTPDAFRFFLPAFMRAALLNPEVIDTGREFTFSCLTPAKEDDPEGTAYFMARVEKLTPAQRAAARAFVDLYVEIENTYPDPERDRAAAFWSQY